MTTKSFLVGYAAFSAVFASPVPQWDETDVPQIIGGVPAQVGDFPYIISFQSNGSHFCGGSLLDSTTVLTAGHCVAGQTINGLTVRAGTLYTNSGGVISPIASLHVHPEYNFLTIDKDVAILKLQTPIPQSSTIKYATLAAAGSDPADGSICTTAGWGTTLNSTDSPLILRKVDIPIVSRAKCQAMYLKDTPPRNVTENMICAGTITGGKDHCYGDSGGPVVAASTGTLIGTVSWAQGCASAAFPGVDARVGSLREFIDQYL